MTGCATSPVGPGAAGIRIAVVGAGWAGLSAALALRRAGGDATVFEAAATPGGRARRVDDAVLGGIDNGQHLMLGAYSETLALVRELNPGTDIDDLLLRVPLHLESLDGGFRLRAARLPAPLHTLAGLLTARGMSAGERIGALRMLGKWRLGGWRAPGKAMTVAALLDRHRQSAAARDRLWNPLCLAAMNTPAACASAQIFLNVLRDSMGADAHAGDLLLARTDLSRLWPEAAARQIRLATRRLVQSVEPSEDHVLVDSAPFDACILAVPPYAASRLLARAPDTPALAAWRETLGSFSYRRIATVVLRLASPWPLPRPIMMLDADHGRGDYGQWVVDRSATLVPPPAPAELAVVISDAGDDLPRRHDDLAARIGAQIRRQAAGRQAMAPMPEIVAHRVIVEKRATFSCTPDQIRPDNRTLLPRVWVAGDWTDTGYPSVLEGAVRSGSAAARALMASGIWPITRT